MITVFLDASVLFSACYSSTGASHEIIRQGYQNNLHIVLSEDVLLEVERNLGNKKPEALQLFQVFIATLPYRLVNPTIDEVKHAATYTELKDAPIVAAARKAQVDYLVSFDLQHLVNVPEVATRSDLQIVLPSQLLEIFRNL